MSITMKTPSSIISLCLVVSLLILQQNPAFGSRILAADLIAQTCGASNVLYKDLCLATLRADPTASSADINGLAAIALSAVSADVAVVRGKISELVKSTTDKYTLGALKDCKENYGDVRETIDDVAVPALKARRYDDVLTYVSAMMTDGDTCEDGFKKGTSKLTSENVKFGQLCSNVLAISNQAKA